jgi:hypothetical protein
MGYGREDAGADKWKNPSGATPAVLIGDRLRCPLGHNTTAAALAAAQAFYESTNWRVSLKAETV